MNTETINEAFKRISKRRNDAIATYDKHIREVEEAIPEIVYLNNQIANTSRNVIVTSLSKGIDIKDRIKEIEEANRYAQQRTAELLRIHKYPSDYLDIKYTCPMCCDTGYKKGSSEYCQCVTKLINQINSENVNKNTALKLCTFDTFNLDYYKNKPAVKSISDGMIVPYDRMKKILEDCKKYVDSFTIPSPNILMTGSTGLGKTHLSLAIANSVMQKGYSVIYGSALDMFATIEREKFAKYNSSSESLDSMLNTDLLIIDDLGVEYDNKFYKSVLYNIINTRYMKDLPTIINTNFTIEQLQAKYDVRITSRLLVYVAMRFVGSDVRSNKLSEIQ